MNKEKLNFNNEIFKEFLKAFLENFDLIKDKRPEKNWFYHCVNSVRRKAPEVDNPQALCAWVWYYHMGEGRLREVLKETYGKIKGEAREKLLHTLGLREKKKKKRKRKSIDNIDFQKSEIEDINEIQKALFIEFTKYLIKNRKI
ncbi:MAG: hypothetical protein ABIL45_03565 [candidate division WOR-3 bacterium]